MNPPALALPDALRDEAEDALTTLKEAQASPLFDEHREALLRLYAVSPFCAMLARTHPDLTASYLEDPEARFPAQELNDCEDANDFARQLRRARAREMMRIAHHDLNGQASVMETLRDLTAFADTAVLAARDWHRDHMRKDPPLDAAGEPVPMQIQGMGKLGGAELNFSSDIDLIFSYPDPASDREKAQEYFILLGQRLIRALDDVTAEGFVFRVDMRLRPFGSSGALALPFSSVKNYYQHHGREWERYAMLKARVLGPPTPEGKELTALLQPFIYRKFLDFRVMDELREMKTKMEQHAQHSQHENIEDDLKHGPGGIREAEFIVQASQLVFGGREEELRLSCWHEALDALERAHKIPTEDADPLRGAYRFLRRVENAVQMMEDQQVHLLPEEELHRERLRFAMGFESWEDFVGALNTHREYLHEEYTRLMHVPQDSPQPRAAEAALEHQLRAIEAQPDEKVDLSDALRELGLRNPQQPAQHLRGIFSHALWRMQSDDTQRLTLALIPHMIDAACTQEDPDSTAARLFRLLETLLHQPSHLSMLLENLKILELLTRIISNSSLLLTQLLRSPDLVDELLDAEALFAEPDEHAAQQILDYAMRHTEGDLELEMQVLRRFRQAQMFRVAVCDVMGVRPISDVSDELTWIAEAVTRCAWEMATREQIARHGRPCYRHDGEPHEAYGAVLAYGKFGGLELGYTSDLDLVFVHDSHGEEQRTDGDKPVDNEYFFTRVTQRFIHIMETLTADGVLYEVDPQLRPAGKYGLTVCSLQYYEKYLREKAWTWEHQALVRARPVAGEPSIQQACTAIRTQILRVPRDRGEMQQEFTGMRQKMYDAAPSKAGYFNLKSDPGGITDLEFLVQFETLMHAAEHPKILDVTATVQILEQLEAAALLDTETAVFMRDCYFLYRDRLHELSLQEHPLVVADEEMQDARARLRSLWDKTFDTAA